MDLEELVRAAQDRQAGRAPTDRVRAALPSRITHARRRRRIFTAAGSAVAAVAVAGAIAVPSLATRGGGATVAHRPGATVTPSQVTSTELPSAAARRTYRLAYRPTWVPAGYRERIRSANDANPPESAGSSLMRVWKKHVGLGDPWGGAGLTLYVTSGLADSSTQLDTNGKPVVVNGSHGFYVPSQGDHKSYVGWTVDAHTALMVSADHLDISEQSLVRMARSVVPDTGTLPSPVVCGWLPDGWTATGFQVSGDAAATWRAEVFLSNPDAPVSKVPSSDPNTQGSLSIVVGSTTDAPAGGAKLTVGGHPARHPVRTDESGKSLTYLVVDLGRGRLMTLIGSGGGLTLATIEKIAARTDVSTTAPSWLG
jgi:hypothetical protein